MSMKTIVLLALLAGVAAASPTGGNLKRFCSKKGVSLKTVDDLAALVKEADSNPSDCPDNVVQALRDMKRITDDTKACTMEKAEAITGFVDKYLKESAESVPQALADFALAYGMRVSGVCSREMVDSFSSQADALLRDKLSPQAYKGFREFMQFLTEESFAGVLLAPIIKTGEVLLPVDLMQMGPDDNKGMQVYSSQSESSQKIGKLCQRVLQPLYEPTLLPLAHLIRAGFVNRDIPKGKKFEENGRFWSTAVFFCESLKMIEVKERNTPEQLAIEAKLGEANSNLAGQEVDSSEDESQGAPVESLLIEAPESSGQIGDKIVSSSVRSLVKNFNANKSEVERLRARIARRGMHVLKMMYKRDLLGASLTDALNLVKVKDESQASQFEQVKTAMVEYVEGSGHERGALADKSMVRVDDAGESSLGQSIVKGIKTVSWRSISLLPLAAFNIVTTIIFSSIGLLGIFSGSAKLRDFGLDWLEESQNKAVKVFRWDFKNL